MMFQTMENFSSANDTIESNCRLPSYEKNTKKYFYILKKEASRSKVTPLNKNPKIIKIVADCKHQLKRKRLNTKRTDGIFVIVDKALALTKKESLALKSLGPSKTVMNKIFP